jgi:hypothetical protein
MSDVSVGKRIRPHRVTPSGGDQRRVCASVPVIDYDNGCLRLRFVSIGRSVRRAMKFLSLNNFERIVADFARCLRLGGLPLPHTTSFRFCDMATARDFDVALEADLTQLAPDILFAATTG